MEEVDKKIEEQTKKEDDKFAELSAAAMKDAHPHKEEKLGCDMVRVSTHAQALQVATQARGAKKSIYLKRAMHFVPDSCFELLNEIVGYMREYRHAKRDSAKHQGSHDQKDALLWYAWCWCLSTSV